VSGATVLSARDVRVELKSRRGSFQLIADALDLHAREALVILGPNGSGKSTLMRTLAGLEQPVGGRVASVAAGPVTMVFQRPAPLAGSVAHNVRVVFLGKKLSGAALRSEVDEALERFKIDHLAEHRAVTLSGGEMRRLALARAFALRPAVLLLDEPFAGLDADGQAALSLDLRRAISETGVAVAMVTHDMRRAMLLADRIAVLIDGRLAQIGRRDDVLEQPSTPEIAQVVGMTNLVRGVVTDERRDDLALVEIDAQHRVATHRECSAGDRVWVGIRPEHIKLDVGRGAVNPIGTGVVRGFVNDGVALTVQVDWAGTELRTHLMAGRGLARTLQVGASVALSASPEHVHLIPVSPRG
jgi:ABC-type Fe3+/spermidine/putrescine transport system ATPase subunit